VDHPISNHIMSVACRMVDPTTRAGLSPCARTGTAVLDGALADRAEAYGKQTLKDHAALTRAIKSGHKGANWRHP
jgi:hypothetical protein